MQLEEKSLNEIKRDIALVTLDIESLNYEKKEMAILHLKETIDLLQLGSHNKRIKEDPGANESPEKKIKLDPENIDEENSSNNWMFNEDTFEKMNAENIPVAEEYEFTKSLYRGMIPTCDLCGATFVTVGALDSHMKACHANIKQEENFEDTINEHEEKKMEMCPIEQSTKVNEASLLMNAENILVAEENELTKSLYGRMIPTCDFCGATFVTVGALDSHMKACHANIKQEDNFEDTIIEHEEKKMEMCPIEQSTKVNEASLFIKTELDNSFIVEMDDKGFYNCQKPNCGRRFTNRNSLKNHLNIHTDKFKCSGCGQTFMSNFFLKQHKKNPANCEKILRIRENLRQKTPIILKEEVEEEENVLPESKFMSESASVNVDQAAYDADTENSYNMLEEASERELEQMTYAGEKSSESVSENQKNLNVSRGLSSHYSDESVTPNDSSNTIEGSYIGLEQSRNDGKLSEDESLTSFNSGNGSLDDTSYQSQSIAVDEITIDDEPPILEVSTSSKDNESSSQEVFDVFDDEPPQLEVMTPPNVRGSAQQNTVSRDEKMFVCEAPDCGREFSKRDTFTRHKHEHTDRYKCEKCGTRFSGMKPLKQHNCEKILRKQREAENNPVPAVKRKYRRKNKENVSFKADTSTEDESQLQTDEEDLIHQDVEVGKSQGLTDEATQPECVNQENEEDEDDELDVDLIRCEVCDKYFISQESLENHKSQCAGEQADTVDLTTEENINAELQDAGQAETMSVEAETIDKRQDVEITMNAGPGIVEDITVLQQSYPGISFIPKIKSEL